MSNPLPPGVVPKLYRQRNKDGKEVGSWYVNVKKKPINLRTQDYFKARERAKLAYNDGKRDFEDDRYAETKLLGAMPAPKSEPLLDIPESREQPQPKPSGDWTSDVSSAASAGFRPEVFDPGTDAKPQPDTILPQYEAPKEKESKKGGSGTTHVSPEMIESIIKQAAQVIVELQIQGQEYLWRRWGKIEAGKVPENHDSRKVAQDLWHQAIREWIPVDLPIPPWLLAPIVCAALTVPVQIEGAKPLPTTPTAVP